jgi:putative endonuclease
MFLPMFYTYVLRCSDGDLYIGSAKDLRDRFAKHEAGRVPATVYRRPVTLEYYEACRSEAKARLREKQLKKSPVSSRQGQQRALRDGIP